MNLNQLEKALFSDCVTYIEKLRACTPGSILLRGYFGEIKIAQKFHHNLLYRKPLNTPEDIHNTVNAKFEKKFGWRIRNGIFCYGFNIRSSEDPEELGYGPFHICFPNGDCKIVFSPTMIDMFDHISITDKELESVINEFDFRDGTLCEAIESGDRKDINVSNEISVCSNAYYLINYKYKEWVDELIWR